MNAKKQRKKIEGFRITDHFLFREWDRKISTELLTYVLRKLKNKKTKKQIIIVSREITKKTEKCNLELFLIIHNKVLITCFFSELKFQMGKKVSEKYLLISKCETLIAE